MNQSIYKDILLIGINSKYIHPAMGIFQLYTNTDKEKYNLDYFEFENSF